MFNNIRNGWATLTLGKFIGQCSYLTDPVLDIAEVLCNRCGVVEFDEEGSMFEVIITSHDVYVVSHRETDELHMTNITTEQFAKLFVENVKNNMDAWIDWFGYCEDDDIDAMRLARKDIINEKIEIIKTTYNMVFDS